MPKHQVSNLFVECHDCQMECCRSFGRRNEMAEKQALDGMVNDFSNQMKERLHEKYKQGYRGWADPASKRNIMDKLCTAMGSCKWVDVANLSAMLWNMEQEA